MFRDQIPKYRKKLKKVVKKSEHKHEYKECLIKDSNFLFKSSYCVKCGKIGELEIDSIECANGRHMMLSKEGMLKKYDYLEVKEINSVLTDKYVSISKEDKNN